ncbi:hypothetical protein V6N13_058605 [Hibiscus sabdariffa]|uniref:Transposase MuDR plant domain-containing protein n=1 Tax=Hibiscus sabdariffa TaxID=183260 RepID=A0ABR2GFP2_9ROSI
MVHRLKCGLNKAKHLFFLEPGKSLEDGLKLLFNDNSVLELSNYLKIFGEISIYVDHVGDENDKSIDVSLPKVFSESFDVSTDDDGKKINMDDVEDDLDMHDINLSSDKGNDELVDARAKVTKYVKDLDRLNIEDVGGSGPSQIRGTKNHFVEPSKTYHMTDDGLDSDYIDSDDPGSYISTSEDLDADDARKEILASAHGNDNSFRVKTYISEHSCLPTIHNKRLTSNVIASKFRDEISRMPYMKAIHIRALVRQKLGVVVNISKVRRAKLQVVNKIQEKYVEEFK